LVVVVQEASAVSFGSRQADPAFGVCEDRHQKPSSTGVVVSHDAWRTSI
jgi:hypothetical protein